MGQAKNEAGLYRNGTGERWSQAQATLGMEIAIEKASASGMNSHAKPKKENRMATEAKAIKDELVLRLAKKHCKPDQQWRTEHHAMLLWDYFREKGFLKGASPEEVAKAGKEWVSFYSNSHSGYASNQAKHMAASGICRASTAESLMAEFA